MATGSYDGVKVFTATKANDRAALGEKVSEWLTAHPKNEVIDIVVTQSSDRAFHCLSFTLFWRTAPAATGPG